VEARGARRQADQGPDQRHDGTKASIADPSTWTDFETASTTAARPDIDGIGFVFSEGDPFTGIDLDACLIDGELHPDAAHIVETLGSYTERSPWRTGLHAPPRGGAVGRRDRGL
jgi:putative DNA primase/helicase